MLCGIAAGQVSSGPSYPYLLRLDRSNFEGHSCALLQNTGAFHLEVNNGDEVRVYEGVVGASELAKIESDLNSTALVSLAQSDIQEPLIRTRHDEVQVSIFRGEAWQDLLFLSSDSQQSFKPWLRPLLHWLEALPRLPHRELSEDAGSNRCLPLGVITLKKRGEAAPEALAARTTMHVIYGGRAPEAQPPPPPAVTQSVSPLLLLQRLEMKSERAHESCVLVGENGMYRFENRTQKAGKPVKTKITSGQIKADELQQLHRILDDPALVDIKHREPPGHGDVPMMGDKLDITISRPAGVQHFILSSRFNRPDFPSFYRGDADVSVAQPLLKFLAEYVENNPGGTLDPSKRNSCSEAP